MGEIAVHEFMTLDGVIEAPTWTFDYPFDPKMGEAIGGLMGSSQGLLLGGAAHNFGFNFAFVRFSLLPVRR
jgi:hypothetical protein